jgi:hypothetical protein
METPHMTDEENDEKTPISSTLIGLAAEGPVPAGTAPLPRWLDTNGNGLADVREPELWLTMMEVATSIITKFAPSHTVAFRYADFYRQQVLPRLKS